MATPDHVTKILNYSDILILIWDSDRKWHCIRTKQNKHGIFSANLICSLAPEEWQLNPPPVFRIHNRLGKMGCCGSHMCHYHGNMRALFGTQILLQSFGYCGWLPEPWLWMPKMVLLHFTFQKQLEAFCCATESGISIQLPALLFVSHEALLDFLSLSRGAAISHLLMHTIHREPGWRNVY